MIEVVDSGDESDGQSAARAVASKLKEKRSRGPQNASETQFFVPRAVVLSIEGSSKKRWQFKCRHCNACVTICVYAIYF